MSSVDYVEININNIGIAIEILLDIKNNLITINKEQKSISDKKIQELFRIIRNWKDFYDVSNFIDNEKFIIKITSGKNIDTIVGNGTYPDNYVEFKKWVGAIYE